MFLKFFRRPDPKPLSLSSDSQKLAYIREYLNNSLALFQRDPSDSLYQKGYEAATEEFLRYVNDLG